MVKPETIEPQNQVRDQHLVSRVLLRQWSVEGRVQAIDLRGGTTRLRSPKSEGFVRWYVKGEQSGSMEKIWQRVENRAPAAIDAVAAGTLFEHPAHVGTVKDLVALHLVRARHTAVMWEHALARNLDGGHAANIVAMADDPAFLAGHFRDRTGFHPAGPGALIEERDRILGELDARVGSGGAGFASALQREFGKVRDHLESRGLEIGFAERGQFLIGDNPAVTHDRDSGAIGLLGGAKIGASDLLILPLGPSHAVAGGGENLYRQLPPEAVDHANILQMSAAFDKVYCRPDSGLHEWALTKRDEYLSSAAQGPRRLEDREAPDG